MATAAPTKTVCKRVRVTPVVRDCRTCVHRKGFVGQGPCRGCQQVVMTNWQRG